MSGRGMPTERRSIVADPINPGEPERLGRMAAELGSDNLLTAMLRMGARRSGIPGLPGLDDARFRRLCAERRIPIEVHPEPPLLFNGRLRSLT